MPLTRTVKSAASLCFLLPVMAGVGCGKRHFIIVFYRSKFSERFARSRLFLWSLVYLSSGVLNRGCRCNSRLAEFERRGQVRSVFTI